MRKAKPAPVITTTATSTSAAPIIPPKAPDLTSIENVRNALASIRTDATDVSAALSVHLRTVAGDPELHGRLHRLQIELGSLLHGLGSANAA